MATGAQTRREAPPQKLRVLLIEDNSNDAELARAELRRNGFEVISDVVQSGEAVSACLEQNVYDVILAD